MHAPGYEDASPTDDPFLPGALLCDKLWLPRWAGTCLQSLHLCCAVGQRLVCCWSLLCNSEQARLTCWAAPVAGLHSGLG